MSCIHSYYITLKFVLIGDKLHRYKTSFVHLYQCCVNPGNFVRVRVRDRLQPYLWNQTGWHSIYTTFTIDNDFTIFFTNLYPYVKNRGSSPVNHILRLSESTSNDSNMPESIKNFLVFKVILRITARIPYEYNVLLRFVLHLIWLIIQKECSRFTWAGLFHMPVTLTFKALGAGVGSWHALDWAFTFEISRRSRTVTVSYTHLTLPTIYSV